jgi:hypothetical protein
MHRLCDVGGSGLFRQENRFRRANLPDLDFPKVRDEISKLAGERVK